MGFSCQHPHHLPAALIISLTPEIGGEAAGKGLEARASKAGSLWAGGGDRDEQDGAWRRAEVMAHWCVLDHTAQLLWPCLHPHLCVSLSMQPRLYVMWVSEPHPSVHPWWPEACGSSAPPPPSHPQ